MAGTKDSDKVFDVAKPGDSKPETGSKPMVVGHKFMGSDPTLKPEKNEPDSVEAQNIKIEVKPKLKLAPITIEDTQKDDVVVEESSSELKVSSKDDNNIVAPVKKTAEEIQTEETATELNEQKEAVATKEEQKQEADNIQLERDNRLQELIKSKQYFVPIKKASTSSLKTFLITFFTVSIIGLGIIAALIDAEVIDLGIKLPFNLL